MEESIEHRSLPAGRRAALGLEPYAASSVPALDKAYVSPELRIMSRVADHKRAGLLHPIAHVVHPEGSFSNVQVAQLKADPNLVVEEVVDGKVEVAFDPVHTERQLDAHLAHDPVGLANLLRSMAPRFAQVLGGLPIGEVMHVSQEGPGGAPGSVAMSAETVIDPATGAAFSLDDVVSGKAGLSIGIPISSGVEQGSARQGHSLEVGGSNPPPASTTGAPPPPPPASETGGQAEEDSEAGDGAASAPGRRRGQGGAS